MLNRFKKIRCGSTALFSTPYGALECEVVEIQPMGWFRRKQYVLEATFESGEKGHLIATRDELTPIARKAIGYKYGG